MYCGGNAYFTSQVKWGSTKLGEDYGSVQNRVVYNTVFLVGIGWYFLSILPTDTEGKLGWYVSV
jgi:hypothetical protein